jgi:predicted Zn-dependent protease
MAKRRTAPLQPAARGLFLGVALALSPASASAHGSVHERIEAIGEELARRPGDASLLVERGDLWVLDGSHALAARDFEAAQAIDPALPDLERKLANALLQAGEPSRALPHLDALLAREPDHADGLLVRARVQAALGRREAADRDYERAIALSSPPSPRLYRERAQLAREGGDPETAIQTLEAGIARLGPIAALIELAGEIERERGRHEAALGHLARLPPALGESPRWRLERAEILRALERREDARREVEGALAALDGLPPSRRDAPANLALRTQLIALRQTLEPPPGPAAASEPQGTRWLVGLVALIAALVLGLVAARRVRRGG